MTSRPPLRFGANENNFPYAVIAQLVQVTVQENQLVQKLACDGNGGALLFRAPEWSEAQRSWSNADRRRLWPHEKW